MREIKAEYFNQPDIPQPKYLAMSDMQDVFPQERDWTCSIACLRSIVSGKENNFTEDTAVDYYDIYVGPQTSLDIKRWLPYNYKNFRFGCDSPIEEDSALSQLVQLMRTHNVMIECTLNYEHWIVLLGYVHLWSAQDSVFVIYDPYYNQVRTMMAEELISMWCYITTDGPERDYVACKK